jgi:hypothetical protein
MKHKILLSAFLIFISVFSIAQKGNKAYAITGQSSGNLNWTDIREIDLSTGKMSNTIFETGKTKFTLTGTSGSKNFTQLSNAVLPSGTPDSYSPTQSMVAAAAYDKRHNKLFFTPMRIGELRWMELSSRADDARFFTVQSQLLNTGNLNEEANHITRMVIGADGNGYALTNDGKQFMQFTTGKKTVITNLGSLIDAASNNGISIFNKCSSWGGDMVADTRGKLYLFTATQHVFTIDIETRVAKHVGSIKSLSPTFTVNGAAVDNDNNVIVSSANTFEGFYKINIKDLNASKIQTTGQVFNASDLANSNLLFENQLREDVGVASLLQRETIGNNMVSIYPNPVSGSQFKVTFDKSRAGRYDIALTDAQGRMLMNRRVNVRSSKQVETIQMKLKPAGGMYMIKVSDGNKKSIFADKIVID